MIQRVAVASLLLLAFAHRAHADAPRPQDVPRVLFAGVEATSESVPPLVARRAAEQIAADLAEEPSVQLLVIADDPTDTVALPPTVADLRDDAAKGLASANAALGKKDWSTAETMAAAAVHEYEASAAVVTDVAPLASAWLALGTAQAMQGKGEAQTSYLQALALGLDKPPAFAKNQAKARKLFEAAQKTDKTAPRGGLAVDVKPGEATSIVSIDGATHGEAPVQVLDLPAGRHLVRVTAEGYRPFAQVVTVAAGDPAPLVVNLEPAVVSATAPDAVRAALRAELRKRARSGVLDATTKPIAARLAERIGATHILIGLIAPAAGGYTLRVFLFQAKGQLLAELDAAALDAELLDLDKQTLSTSRAAVASIRDFPAGRDITTSITQVGGNGGQGGNGALVEDARRRRRLHEDTGPAPKPIWRRTWFWVGVGGVVVGAVALSVAIASSGSPSGYDGTVTLP